MFRLVLGNCFGALCGLFCTLSAFGKTKKQTMFLQCLDCMSGIISCLLLQGYSGALTQTVSLVRNYLLYKERMIKMLQTILIFTVAVLGIVTNNRGLLGLLPVIASVGYTILILKTDSVNWVRIGLAVNNFLWIIYDLIIQNYVNAVIGVFTVVSCIYNLVRHRVDKC